MRLGRKAVRWSPVPLRVRKFLRRPLRVPRWRTRKHFPRVRHSACWSTRLAPTLRSPFPWMRILIKWPMIKERLSRRRSMNGATPPMAIRARSFFGAGLMISTTSLRPLRRIPRCRMRVPISVLSMDPTIWLWPSVRRSTPLKVRNTIFPRYASTACVLISTCGSVLARVR